MNVEKVQSMLRAYQWPRLWKEVQTSRETSLLHSAVKAFLLSSWWQERESAEKILRKMPKILSNPLIHNLTVLSWFSVGNPEIANCYRKNRPHRYPQWMLRWQDLEFYGRSGNTQNQVEHLRKWFGGGKEDIPDYVFMALLQSNEHEKTNPAPLIEWAVERGVDTSDSPLAKAFCLMIGLAEFPASPPPHFVLNYRYCVGCVNRQLPKEALVGFDRLAESGFLDYNSLLRWLVISLCLPCGEGFFLNRIQYALGIVPDSLLMKGTIATYHLIFTWIHGRYRHAYSIVREYIEFQDLESSLDIKNTKIFFNYIILLCSIWQENTADYGQDYEAELYVLGESHSLAPANFCFTFNGCKVKGCSRFIMGIKMFHLSGQQKNMQMRYVDEHIRTLPERSNLLFTIGEIDTRADEGIWKAHLEKGLELEKLIWDTVNDYIDYLKKALGDKVFSTITIQGIPAPGYDIDEKVSKEKQHQFLSMIQNLNQVLRKKVLENSWNFLDVYSATVDQATGRSNGRWHLDDYHLSPVFYRQAEKFLA